MATYRVAGYGPELTADRVTRTLGLAPTESWEIGDIVGPTMPLRTQSQWNLGSCPRPQSGVELTVQLERVLGVLLPRSAELWRLVDDGYQVDWFCHLGSHATEHAAELPRPVLQRLMQVPGELLLDVYGDDWDE